MTRISFSYLVDLGLAALSRPSSRSRQYELKFMNKDLCNKICMSTHFNAFLTFWPRSWPWGRGSAPGPPLSGSPTCWGLLNSILQTAWSKQHHSLSSYLHQSPESHLVSELLDPGLSAVSTLRLLSSSLPPSLAPPPGPRPDIAWWTLNWFNLEGGHSACFVSFWKIILFTDLSAISKNWYQLNYTLHWLLYILLPFLNQ